MQESRFSILTRSDLLTPQHWRHAASDSHQAQEPKPSSTPEYLFNNDHIIKRSLQNLGELQIFPVFLLKTKVFCCWVYNPTTAVLGFSRQEQQNCLEAFYFVRLLEESEL